MTVALILGLVASLVLGLVVGGVYFSLMWRSATLFAVGVRVSLGVALVVARFALVLVALGLVVTHGGAGPVLATALGIVIARAFAMRWVRGMAA